MTDGRQRSRSKAREKIAARENVESELREEIESYLRKAIPTIAPVAARVASKLAAVVSSQIATQPQAKQRSLSQIEDDAEEYATEFVAQFMQAAVRGVKGQVRKTMAVKADDLGMALADDWAGPVAGPTLLERTFGIPRSTLHRWRRLNQAIALNTRTTQKPVFPLLQFVDGRPVGGLNEVVDALGDPKKAWAWLITPSSEFNGARPITLLRNGEVGPVLEAARSRTA